MIGRFGRDALIYAATTVLARGTAFLLVPILARALDPADLGVVELAAVSMTFVNILISLEIGQALARYVPDTANAGQTRSIASTALWFVIGSYAIAGLASVVVLSVIDPATLTGTTGSLVLATASVGIFLLMQGQLRWELRPHAYAATAIVYAGTTLLATGLLILLGAGLAGVFLGQAIGAGVGIALVVLSRPAFGWTFSMSWLSRLLAFSLPLVPATIATLGALFVDRFVIGAARSLEDVAIFSVGYRIAAAVGIVISAVQLALTPLIYAGYRRAEAPAEIASAALLVSGGALSLWVIVSLLAPEIVGVIGTQTYAESATVIPFLSLSIILAGLIVFVPGLTIERRTRSVAVIAMAGLFVNLGLGVSLVGAFGIVGVAFATVTTTAAVLGLMWWFGRSLYPIPFEGQRLAAAFVASGAAVAVSGVVTGHPLGLAARVALAGASIAFLLISTRAFKTWRSQSIGSRAA